MKEKDQKKKPIRDIAHDFFDYLGRHLPQQCASDEFYFLPRSQAAVKHLNDLDDLRPERIQDHIRYVLSLLKQITFEHQNTIESEIDRLHLKQSMESFIREFSEAEVYRNDPTLYIKIPLFATDLIISAGEPVLDQTEEMFSLIFDQIPHFLRVGIENLRSPSEISLQVGFNMAKDAIFFYSHDIRTFIEEKMAGKSRLIKKNHQVLEAWEHYKSALAQQPSRDNFAVGEEGLRRIISVSLAYSRTPKEILEIAQSAYRETLEKVNRYAKKINSRKTWKHIIYDNLPSVQSSEAFIELFKEEVLRLRHFFYSQDVMTLPLGEEVSVIKTPSYLQSLRATASYKAPLTGQGDSHGVFYITPGKEDLELISSHCSYLCAHETYPGHHILDHFRIQHPNPIRRQVESPLFYEGWACYVEQLLDELGYIKDPRQQLIQLKRQLWRNLRAVLDVKLHTRKISFEQAAKEIENLGFSSKRAQRQIRRFCLTPGYQLCYFMGSYEINRLRNEFSSEMRLKSFHDTLLGEGQIPFHLLEKRFEAFH